MVSLSTVYLVSVVLTSIAGMGSAYLGNRVYKGGAQPVSVVAESPPISEPVPEQLIEQPSQESSIEQTSPEVPSESS
jgi:hypothetical protein